MIGEKVEFLIANGTFLEGTIFSLSGDHVVVEDQFKRRWEGQLSQIIFKDGQQKEMDEGESLSKISSLRKSE